MAINCESCTELRENAPDFVQNGVTDKVCASLKNDTGLNPANASNNCDDLTDATDCLVGRMDGEIEGYEVCDWKDYMHKFVGNIYELLKAFVCSMCGLWTNVHNLWTKVNQLCKSIDNVLNLVQGNKPPIHLGEWTDYWKERVAFNDLSDWSWEYFKPVFRAETREGAGCYDDRKLGTFYMDWAYTDQASHYPYIFGYRFIEDIEVGQVIATIKKEDVISDGSMTEAKWKDLLRSSILYEWGTISSDTLIYVSAQGYTIIDGVEFNEHYKEYGEDTMVVTIGKLIGPSRSGGFNGAVGPQIRSYNIG